MPQHAFATSEDGATITAIDLGTLRATAVLPAGPGAHSLALTPDGSRLYVANRRDRTVTVVDTATLTVAATLECSSPPAGAAVSPDGSLLAIAGRTRATLWLLGVPNGELRHEISLGPADVAQPEDSDDGPASTHPVWSADGASVYIEDNPRASIVRIAAGSGQIEATYRLPSPAHMLYLDATKRRMYALCTGFTAGGEPPAVAIIGVDSSEDALVIPVPLAAGESGELHHATFDPGYRRLFVANMGKGRPRGGHSVHVLDTDALRFITRLEARPGAGHPVLSPDGRRLFVVNHASPWISVFSTESLELVGEVQLPGVRSMGHGCFFSGDGSHFWAISNSAGVAYAIDTVKLEVVAEVQTGPGSQDIARTWSDAFA